MTVLKKCVQEDVSYGCYLVHKHCQQNSRHNTLKTSLILPFMVVSYLTVRRQSLQTKASLIADTHTECGVRPLFYIVSKWMWLSQFYDVGGYIVLMITVHQIEQVATVLHCVTRSRVVVQRSRMTCVISCWQAYIRYVCFGLALQSNWRLGPVQRMLLSCTT